MARTKRAKNLKPDDELYLTNVELLPAIERARVEDKITDELAGMFETIIARIGRMPSFNRYTYLEDMKAEALLNLLTYGLKFNPEITQNPFSYYTTCVMNSFLSVIKTEKRQRELKDELLILACQDPSFSFKADLADVAPEIQQEIYDQLKEAEARQAMVK